jgi:hypothetical protein
MESATSQNALVNLFVSLPQLGETETQLSSVSRRNGYVYYISQL